MKKIEDETTEAKLAKEGSAHDEIDENSLEFQRAKKLFFKLYEDRAEVQRLENQAVQITSADLSFSYAFQEPNL